jgi:hypothetical protein
VLPKAGATRPVKDHQYGPIGYKATPKRIAVLTTANEADANGSNMEIGDIFVMESIVATIIDDQGPTLILMLD